MEFNPLNARNWMQWHWREYQDRLTGMVDATGLAEGCASAFNVDDTDGPLDDETHWIWDIAADIAMANER